MLRNTDHYFFLLFYKIAIREGHIVRKKIVCDADMYSPQ